MPKAQINSFLFVLSFFNLISFCLSEIHLPFKTQKFNAEVTNIAEYIKNLIYNDIYIELEVGSPEPQIIKSFLKLQEHPFFIQGKDIPVSQYDQSKSFSYQKNKHYYFVEGEEVIKNGYSSNDTITVQTKNKINGNNKIKSILNFILVEDSPSKTQSPSNIGLLIPDQYSSIPDYSFITQLKKNDLIKYHSFVINYTSDNEGDFIVGGPPHIYNSKKYKFSNYNTVNAKYPINYWTYALDFSSITYGNNENNIEKRLQGRLVTETGLIVGTKEYQELVEKEFFENKIKNGDCFKDSISAVIEWREGQKNYEYYYCKKNSNNVNIKKLETLRFHHKGFNYTFEFNYKDLFDEYDDYYIFKIIFDKQNFYWIFGKTWLKKYLMVFDQDSKLIGFYNKVGEENEEDNNKKGSINVGQWIIFGIVTLVAIALGGILIYIFYFKKDRKKRFNEVDEDFEYDSKIDGNGQLIN